MSLGMSMADQLEIRYRLRSGTQPAVRQQMPVSTWRDDIGEVDFANLQKFLISFQPVIGDFGLTVLGVGTTTFGSKHFVELERSLVKQQATALVPFATRRGEDLDLVLFAQSDVQRRRLRALRASPNADVMPDKLPIWARLVVQHGVQQGFRANQNSGYADGKAYLKGSRQLKVEEGQVVLTDEKPLARHTLFAPDNHLSVELHPTTGRVIHIRATLDIAASHLMKFERQRMCFVLLAENGQMDPAVNG